MIAARITRDGAKIRVCGIEEARSRLAARLRKGDHVIGFDHELDFVELMIDVLLFHFGDVEFQLDSLPAWLLVVLAVVVVVVLAVVVVVVVEGQC